MSNQLIIEHTEIGRNELAGKVAVVTGAGQGIGRETARALAYLGASVVIAEISETGRETERVIHGEGGRALFVRTDVSDPDSMENLRHLALNSFGEVDILVNDAAYYTAKPLLELSLEEWDRVFAVNLRGAFLGIKTFLPSMLRRKSGTFVIMESAEGMPYIAPYLASKTGLRSLAGSLAQEVGMGSGVSVYGFNPGMVDTPGASKAFRQMAALYGLSLEEFIRMSGGQLISPEICGTGLAGTILYAKEFHGEETSYFVGLAKMGLDATGEPLKNAGEIPEGTETPALPPASGEALSLYQEVLAGNLKMEDLIHENIREYDELTAFQRPVIKRMFKQGTGLKVEDWLASAEKMTHLIRKALADHVDLNALAGPGKLASYKAQLDRMAGFITKQESDARGWIKDQSKLKVALEALEGRKKTVQTLAGLIQYLE